MKDIFSRDKNFSWDRNFSRIGSLPVKVIFPVTGVFRDREFSGI
jgi:hypothetical protein